MLSPRGERDFGRDREKGPDNTGGEDKVAHELTRCLSRDETEGASASSTCGKAEVASTPLNHEHPKQSRSTFMAAYLGSNGMH